MPCTATTRSRCPLGSLTWPADESETAGLAPGEAERLREIIRVVQESGTSEVTIEEGEMRVTVRRTDEGGEGLVLPLPVPTAPVHEDPDGPTEPPQNDVIRIESPMVGTFYRAPQPDADPFVEEGDTVEGADALHPRGDEADERGEGGVRGRRAPRLRRERRACAVRRPPVRARAAERPAARRALDVPGPSPARRIY